MYPSSAQPSERPSEISDNPDFALELRDNLAEFLRITLAEIEAGTSEMVSVESVAAGLGLNWQPSACEVRFISLARQILARWENAPIAPSILDKLQELAANFDAIEAEPVVGQWSDLYKLKVGERHVIYTANSENKMITVYLIGHWRELYKRQT